jgi:hypothetical protein
MLTKQYVKYYCSPCKAYLLSYHAYVLIYLRETDEDIQNREDLELLVNEFYKKVINDPIIGDFFTKIVDFSWKSTFLLWFHSGKHSYWDLPHTNEIL